MDSKHENGLENIYTVNANGHVSMSIARKAWDKMHEKKPMRSFVISDSTWFGTANLGISLITNLNRSWPDMKYMVS